MPQWPWKTELPREKRTALGKRDTFAPAVEDRVADPSQVRRLCEVVAPAARPDEDVVGEVARVRVRLLLWRREDAAERRDVLVVPGVPVGDRNTVSMVLLSSPMVIVKRKFYKR